MWRSFLHTISWCVLWQALDFLGQEATMILAFSGCFRSGLVRVRNIPGSHSMLMSSASDEKESQQTEPFWILLAEEEESLRTEIGEYLSNEGDYTVTGVADAKSTLLVCRGTVRPDIIFSDNKKSTKRPDCLVIDVRLPGKMNGLDLLKVVRSDPVLQFLPVVLLAERAKAEDRLEGYDAGADAYLSKPFDLEELLSVIDRLLKRSRSSQKSSERSDKLLMIKSEEIRRELAEIKSLLIKSGFATNDSFNKTSEADGSIQQDLKQIKESILHGNIQEQQNCTTQNNNSDQEIMPTEACSQTLLRDEISIMNLIDQGMTNKEVAITTGLPIETVTEKIKGIFIKASVKSKTDLVKWWRNQTDAS